MRRCVAFDGWSRRSPADPLKYENEETENIRKDGTRIWMAWRNKPILNSDGSLREILTVGIDITERRRIEQQIKEQKQLLENTLESLTHPFYVIDANDYSIQVANSAARSLGVSDESTCHALTHRSSTPCNSKEDPCPLLEVKKTGKTGDHGAHPLRRGGYAPLRRGPRLSDLRCRRRRRSDDRVLAGYHRTQGDGDSSCETRERPPRRPTAPRVPSSPT